MLNNAGQDALLEQFNKLIEFSPRDFYSNSLNSDKFWNRILPALAAARATESLAIVRQAMEDFKKEFEQGWVVIRMNDCCGACQCHTQQYSGQTDETDHEHASRIPRERTALKRPENGYLSRARTHLSCRQE
jgi:hypothetical protein